MVTAITSTAPSPCDAEGFYWKGAIWLPMGARPHVLLNPVKMPPRENRSCIICGHEQQANWCSHQVPGVAAIHPEEHGGLRAPRHPTHERHIQGGTEQELQPRDRVVGCSQNLARDRRRFRATRCGMLQLKRQFNYSSVHVQKAACLNSMPKSPSSSQPGKRSQNFGCGPSDSHLLLKRPLGGLIEKTSEQDEGHNVSDRLHNRHSKEAGSCGSAKQEKPGLRDQLKEKLWMARVVCSSNPPSGTSAGSATYSPALTLQD